MAAQQHIEPRNTFTAPALQPLLNSSEAIAGNQSQSSKKVVTRDMVSEIKKHYRLNMLKNFIDQEANTVKSGSKSGKLPGSKSANTKEEKLSGT